MKSAVPRNSPLLGVSFPDPAHTRSRYLEAVGEDIYVVKDSQAAVITRSGVVRVGWNFLDLDYGPYSALRTMPAFSRGKTTMPRVVSLWTHDWSSYYHWLIDVAPKIASAKRYFGSKIADVTFVYPRALAHYEMETIDMLGIKLENVANSHDVGEITAREIVALPLPGWHKVSPRIFELRRLLAMPSSPERRLYIARSGRRKVANEDQLLRMLQLHGFEHIVDRSRSMRQQIALFASASHIVAPHGAGLSNMLWASPSTQVLELADSAYAPDFFVNLAATLGIHLDRLTFGTQTSHWTNMAKDFEVDLGVVERHLKEKWQM
jgi:capsular polysaccharide biosynthesis protein